jgi:hypothetical protein
MEGKSYSLKMTKLFYARDKKLFEFLSVSHLSYALAAPKLQLWGKITYKLKSYKNIY